MASAPWVPEAQNRVFNIGADTPYTVNDLAHSVADAMGVPGHPVKHLEARNEAKLAYSDHTAVHGVFGQLPQTPLDEGLHKMAEWVRLVGARQSSRFSNIEVARNMPPAWRN